jgi:hypothetical protein
LKINGIFSVFSRVARPAKRTAALSEDAKKQLGAIGYLH